MTTLLKTPLLGTYDVRDILLGSASACALNTLGGKQVIW
jgi:hypothetical protein